MTPSSKDPPELPPVPTKPRALRRPTRLSRKYGFTGPCYAARPGVPLVFVDLGRRKIGWAIYANGTLKACGTYLEPTYATWDPSRVARGVVQRVLVAADVTQERTGLDWVCEWPHVQADFRVATENIEDLQAVGKAIGGLIGRWREKYRPHEWKGTIPKGPHHRRVFGLLGSQERTLLPPAAEHDTWDAVAGGLFAVGRCGVGGLA